LKLVFWRLNAGVQLKRTNGDDEWDLDFKAKMDAFTQELTRFALDLCADVDNFDPGDPQ
jgi:hypothetical protein